MEKNLLSKTVVLVIHEIYGVNQHMEMVTQAFTNLGYDVICPDLLNRDIPFDYSEEADAYRYFMDNIGFHTASERVASIVQDCRERYDRIFYRWI